MQKKPYAGKHEPCTCGRFVPAVFPGRTPRVCWFLPGANMMAIIVKVAAGKRPGLELVRDDWPGECHQMVDLMKRCWDQDPKQRPSFAGGTGMWISQGSAPRLDKQGISLCVVFPAASPRFKSLVPFCCHTSPSSLFPSLPRGSCLALGPGAACRAELLCPGRYPCGDRRAAGTDPEPGAGPGERAPCQEDVPQTGHLQEPAGEENPQRHSGSSTESSPCSYRILRLFPLSKVHLSTFAGCVCTGCASVIHLWG